MKKKYLKKKLKTLEKLTSFPCDKINKYPQ